MAKKAVATFSGDKASKRTFVKCIRMEKSDRTGGFLREEVKFIGNNERRGAGDDTLFCFMDMELQEIIDRTVAEYAPLVKASSEAYWEGTVTGNADAFDRYAETNKKKSVRK